MSTVWPWRALILKVFETSSFINRKRVQKRWENSQVWDDNLEKKVEKAGNISKFQVHK